MTVTLAPLLPQADPAPVAALAAEAKALLGREAEGNGLSAAQIRIVREEMRSHCLLGEIGVEFDHRLQQEPRPGRVEAGTPMQDDAAVQAAVQAAVAALCQTPAVLANAEKILQQDEAQGWAMPDTALELDDAKKVFSVAGTCPACAGRDAAGCKPCGGTGAITRVFTLRITAKIAFWLRRQGMNELALLAADKIGPRQLATGNEAGIFIAPLKSDGNRLVAACCCWLPVSRIEFSMEGRFFPATVAGRSGRIVEMEPMLDKWLKPGIAALLKLSRGPLATSPLILTAMRYRLVRQTLQGLMRRPKRQVYLGLCKAYPVGVSDKYRRAAVKYASAAVGALTGDARRRAMRWCVAVAVLLFAGYFFAGRAMLQAAMPDEALCAACDIALLAVPAAGSFFFIRHRAARHLMNITGAKEKPLNLPPAGREAAQAFIWMTLGWLVLAFAAPQPPQWAQQVMQAAEKLAAPVLGPLLGS